MATLPYPPLPSLEVSSTPQSSQRTCSQVVPLALSCDHHMTTVGAACNGHVTTARFNQSTPISSRSPSVPAPPHADCFLFLRALTSCSAHSLSTGKVNYVGSSHHWWHVMVLLGFWWTHHTSAYVFQFWRTTSCDQFYHHTTPLVLTS